jgi:hypothetical protein
MLLAFISLLLLQAADPSAARHSDPAPSDLAAPVAAAMSTGGVRVAVAANTLTFWWVKEIPVKSAAWTDLAEGSLVGAVKIDKDFRDVRGRVIKAGTYTLRYGIQPANGDHLGVSPYREFLLLSPAAADKDAAPRGHDGTVEISKETIGGSHPAVWSLDPPVATDAPLTAHTTELGLKTIVMEVPTQGGALRFALVLVGKIDA